MRVGKSGQKWAKISSKSGQFWEAKNSEKMGFLAFCKFGQFCWKFTDELASFCPINFE